MPGVLVHLDERALVEQQLEALAGGLLAAGVLLLDGALGAGVGDLGDPALEVGQLARGGVDVDVRVGVRDVGAADGADQRRNRCSATMLASLALPPCARSLDREALHEALVTPGSAVAGVEVHPTARLDQRRGGPPAEPWRVVVADHQQAGRGRLGRAWRHPRQHLGRACSVLARRRPGRRLGAAARRPGRAPRALTRGRRRGSGPEVAQRRAGARRRRPQGLRHALRAGTERASSSAWASTSTRPATSCPVDTATSLRLAGAPGVTASASSRPYLDAPRPPARRAQPARGARRRPRGIPRRLRDGRAARSSVHVAGGGVRTRSSRRRRRCGRLTVRRRGRMPWPPATSSRPAALE